MKRLAMFLAFFVLVGLHLTMAQTVQITGLVTSSEDGQPLPGASVTVKGTTVGTVTDFQGKYTLSVPSSAQILAFSFVGMKTQEVAINGRTTVDALIEPTTVGLEEVVVTAMGITRSQKAVGYSVTTVNSAEISKSGQSTLMNSLQGKVAGVTVTSGGGLPGASTKVILRGYASITGNNNPLYVVDGSPIDNTSRVQNGVDFGNGANDINPDDIESVNILKGAAANAIYGSRAANGVIMITTKKGKASDKIKVTFSSNTTFSNPVRLPQNQNEFGQGWNALSDLTQNGSWGPKFNAKIRPWGAIVDNAQLIKPYVALPDNVSDFFDTGTSFNNSITFSGGNEVTNFYLSYANTSENGMIPGNMDINKRNTFAARGTVKGKKITFSASANYVNRNGKNPPDGRGNSNAANLYSDILQIPRDVSIVDQKDYTSTFNSSDSYFTPFAYNPYYSLNEIGSSFQENRFYGNITLDYEIIKNLKATWRVGTDVSNFNREDHEAILSFTPGSYSDLAKKKGDPGYVGNYFDTNTELNSDILLTYNKSITEDIGMNLMAGYNVNERTKKSQLTDVQSLNIPYYYSVLNSSETPLINRLDGTFVDLGPYNSKRRLFGAYGQADFTFKNYWFVTGTYRRDYSSTLPLNNNHFDYYGINSSLVITDVFPALKENKLFSFGKIRASYGTTGNDAAPYSINSVFLQAKLHNPYGNINFPLQGVNAFRQSNQIGNPNLKPELSKEFEVGVDLRFLDNRLRFDITHYTKTTTDQILAVPISPSSGYSTQVMNFGKVENKGWEISISATPIKTKDLDWTVTWNWTKNRNKVLELAPGLDQVLIQSAYDIDFLALPGQPMGIFKGPAPLLDPQGRQVVNDKGFPIAATDKMIYGSSEPNYVAGIISNLTYKGISFGFVIDIRQGGLMYSGTTDLQYFVGNAVQTLYNDRQPFIIPNSAVLDAKGNYIENTVPINMANITDIYYQTLNKVGERQNVISRSYTKLREVTLSYTLPKSLLHKLPITNVEIGIYGKNLLIWTPASNNFIDPESTSYGNDLAGEFGEFRTNPTAKQYGISVKLAF